MKNILGHTNIRTNELSLLARVINDDTKDKEKTLRQLNLIDDLLDIEKMELLLTAPKYTKNGHLRKNQNKTLASFLTDRIDIAIKEEN